MIRAIWVLHNIAYIKVRKRFQIYVGFTDIFEKDSWIIWGKFIYQGVGQSIWKEQEQKMFISSEAITMSWMIVIPENHSTKIENDYKFS